MIAGATSNQPWDLLESPDPKGKGIAGATANQPSGDPWEYPDRKGKGRASTKSPGPQSSRSMSRSRSRQRGIGGGSSWSVNSVDNVVDPIPDEVVIEGFPPPNRYLGSHTGASMGGYATKTEDLPTLPSRASHMTATRLSTGPPSTRAHSLSPHRGRQLQFSGTENLARAGRSQTPSGPTTGRGRLATGETSGSSSRAVQGPPRAQIRHSPSPSPRRRRGVASPGALRDQAMSTIGEEAQLDGGSVPDDLPAIDGVLASETAPTLQETRELLSDRPEVEISQPLDESLEPQPDELDRSIGEDVMQTSQ